MKLFNRKELSLPFQYLHYCQKKIKTFLSQNLLFLPTIILIYSKSLSANRAYFIRIKIRQVPSKLFLYWLSFSSLQMHQQYHKSQYIVLPAAILKIHELHFTKCMEDLYSRSQDFILNVSAFFQSLALKSRVLSRIAKVKKQKNDVSITKFYLIFSTTNYYYIFYNHLIAECVTTNYTEWSPCSASCGSGMQARIRTYVNAEQAKLADCKVQLMETKFCTATISCP